MKGFPSERGVAAAGILLVAMVYVAIAGWFATFRVLWSPDAGPRLAMVRNAATGGGPVFLRYELDALDPRGLLHPLDGYALSLDRGICTTFPALFPVLSVPGYRLGGWGGLLVLPVLAGVAAAGLTYLLGERLELKSRPYLPVVMGLLTPLPIFATNFWDVSLQILLAAGAATLLAPCRSRSRSAQAMGAGVLLGVGVWLHEGFLLLCFALFSAGLLRPGSRLAAWRLIAGAAPLAIAWMACNVWLYGRLGGAHMAGPNDLLHPAHLRLILDPAAIFDRAMVQLVGEPRFSPALAWLSACLVALVVSARCGPRGRRLGTFLYFPIVVLVVDSLQSVPWAGGLFLATPLLAPVLVGLPGEALEPEFNPGERDAEQTVRWFMWASLLFVLLVLLTPKTPGMDWGSRYLLPALPLLLAGAAWNVEVRDRRAEATEKMLIRAAVVVLAAASGYSQVRGLLAVREDLRHSAALKRQVESDPMPVLVTDVWWLGAELTASEVQQHRLLVRQPEEGRLLRAVLENFQKPPFLFAGTEEALEELRAEGGHVVGSYYETERWRAEGLVFARFRPGAEPGR